MTVFPSADIHVDAFQQAPLQGHPRRVTSTPFSFKSCEATLVYSPAAQGRGKEGGIKEEEGQEEEAVWMFKF
jgi:hypothetical protein